MILVLLKGLIVIKVDLKFYGYQLLAVFIIWLGMTFFVDDMMQSGKLIYYLVTSWMLLMVILFIKQFVRERKEKEESTK